MNEKNHKNILELKNNALYEVSNLLVELTDKKYRKDNVELEEALQLLIGFEARLKRPECLGVDGFMCKAYDFYYPKSCGIQKDNFVFVERMNALCAYASFLRTIDDEVDTGLYHCASELVGKAFYKKSASDMIDAILVELHSKEETRVNKIFEKVTKESVLKNYSAALNEQGGHYLPNKYSYIYYHDCDYPKEVKHVFGDLLNALSALSSYLRELENGRVDMELNGVYMDLWDSGFTVLSAIDRNYQLQGFSSKGGLEQDGKSKIEVAFERLKSGEPRSRVKEELNMSGTKFAEAVSLYKVWLEDRSLETSSKSSINMKNYKKID